MTDSLHTVLARPTTLLCAEWDAVGQDAQASATHGQRATGEVAVAKSAYGKIIILDCLADHLCYHADEKV